jgi:predicted Mrr-cat superfamily restriction endonuclease
MAVWLCRAGLRGEYENKFIDRETIYLIGSVVFDLTGMTDKEELTKLIAAKYPLLPDRSVTNMVVQARSFTNRAKVGDWVILPSEGSERLLNIGEITGKYVFDGTKSEFKHGREIDWKYGAWKRDDFNEDIIRSVDAFDTFMTFFKMKQEKRIKEIVERGQPFGPVTTAKRKTIVVVNKPEPEPVEETEPVYPPIDSSELKDAIEELKQAIEEIRSTITEVRKATITQATDVKRVIAEVRSAIEASENAAENASATVYFETDGGYDDDVKCPCGRKGVVCYKYNKMYYDMLKGRRCYRG